jgi:hypothetical protein
VEPAGIEPATSCLQSRSVCPLVSRGVSKSPVIPTILLDSGGRERTARDKLMHPCCTLGVTCVWAAGSRQPSKVRPAASAGGAGRAVQGRSRLGNRRRRVEPRHVLELVHHVPVGAEREPSVVAELAGDVDHRAPLVEQQRRERVPEVVRTAVRESRRLDRALEGSSAPRLVRRKRPGRAGR